MKANNKSQIWIQIRNPIRFMSNKYFLIRKEIRWFRGDSTPRKATNKFGVILNQEVKVEQLKILKFR